MRASIIVEPDIDEARTGNFRRRNALGIRQFTGQHLRQVARFHPRRLGEHHRRIRRQIAEGRVAWHIDSHSCQIHPFWKNTLIDFLFENGDDFLAEIAKNIHEFNASLLIIGGAGVARTDRSCRQRSRRRCAPFVAYSAPLQTYTTGPGAISVHP